MAPALPLRCQGCVTQRGQLFGGYRPRKVQETVLYETVQEHWEAFQQLAGEHGSLPKFVSREFDDYLKCGRLEHGFARVQCTGCGFEHLLPFSCKRRGFCPSCLGRRMNDLSLHLVDEVLPEVPLRQWVVTVPFSLRYRLGFDRRASGQLIRCFHRALRRHMTHRAKEALGQPSGQLCLFTSEALTDPPKKTPSRTPWAKLLARIFKVDAETCPQCGSPCRIVAFVTEKDEVEQVLGSMPRGPPSAMETSNAQLPLLA